MARYAVTVVGPNGAESVRSVPARCEAGKADKTPPHIVVISPPTSVAEGQPVWIKARCLDNRTYDSISATLHYRWPGTEQWRMVPMERRVKAVFTVEVSARIRPPAWNTMSRPATATTRPSTRPRRPRRRCRWSHGRWTSRMSPARPATSALDGHTLAWSAPPGEVFWYRIYRSQRRTSSPARTTFLTYVEKGTTRFRDASEDFAGEKREGPWYYRVTAVSKDDWESPPTAAVKDDRVPPCARSGTRADF